MPDDAGSTGHFRSWVSNGQLLITLLTAAFSFYLSVQQSEIKKTQDKIKNDQDTLALVVNTKMETEKWADRTLAWVEKLSIPVAKQKEAIVIDLLDAIALANASQGGTTDRQKFLHMPLWIALATGNVEAVGLIGNTDNRREVWLNLASGSGDPTVRKTAMEALARSSASKPLDRLLEIYELSEQLNNSDTLDCSILQLGRVIRVMERDPDPARFREDDRVKPLVSRIEVLQTSLAADAAALGGDAKTIAERRGTLQRETQGIERALAFLRGPERVGAEDVQKVTSVRSTFNALFSAWDAAPKSEQGKWALAYGKAILEKLRPNNQLDGKAVFEALDEEIQQAEPGSEQLTKIGAAFSSPSASMPTADVKSLIEGLKSTDTDTRRQSRQALANGNDPKGTDRFLQGLLADESSYRVRLGVASALYQAKLPVVITDPNQVRALVDLIGDDDVLIRKYASESLMKLIDPGTVNLVHSELRRIIQNRASVSPNAVYNAAVVLGTWLRILPSNLQAERASIRSDLTNLKGQLQKDPNWSNTSALIDEMLRLSVATRQSAASAGDRP